jgi:glycosyltransferase involved in cell wall biosynthesis
MNILLLTEAAAAGVGRHALDLAGGLADSGCTVHLVYNPLHTDSMFRLRLTELEGKPGLRVHAFPMRHMPHPADVAAVAALRRYARVNGPFDVVHCHSTKAGLLGRIAFAASDCALVYTPHAPLTMKPDIPPAARACARLLEAALAVPTRRIIAVSEDEEAHLVQLGIPSSKITVVPNGVVRVPAEALRAARFAQRAALGLDPQTVCIGFVGRIERQKRVDVLVDAFASLLRNHPVATRLLIAGDGSQRAALEARVRETPDLAAHVRFLGEVECGAAWMPAFDVFALSSDYEGMPYVLVEALAAGLPLVSTRTGGVSTLITNGWNGFTTPTGDVETFAAALGNVVLQPDLRERMGRNSRVRSGIFTTHEMVARTLSTYEQALETQASPARVVAGTAPASRA